MVGKPAAAFFAAALAHLGADAVMVGNDIETDVLAAQRQGLAGVLVKTGKYLVPCAPRCQRHPGPCPGLLRRPASPARATVMSDRWDDRPRPKLCSMLSAMSRLICQPADDGESQPSGGCDPASPAARL